MPHRALQTVHPHQPDATGGAIPPETRAKARHPPSADSSLAPVKHPRLRERLAHFLAERGRRLTPAQTALVDEFLQSETHNRLDALLDRLREQHPEASMADVKGMMRLLVDVGVARSFLVGDELVFEHQHLDEHHDHLVCIKCGKIQEFVDHTIEDLQLAVAEKAGFRLFFHRLTLHGLCGECARQTTSLTPLGEAPPGRRARVEIIEGGHSMRERLASMGVTRGVELEVIDAGGPVTILVRGARLAIGRGMAAHIHVALAGNGKES